MPRDQKLKMKEIGELVANLLYFCLDPIGRPGFLSPGTQQTVRNNEVSVLSGLNLEKM